MHMTESSVSSATLRAWGKLQGIECRWFSAEAEAVSAVPGHQQELSHSSHHVCRWDSSGTHALKPGLLWEDRSKTR